MNESNVCTTCGEPARLLCSGCKRVFCVEHLERHFIMGYFYFCASCLAQAAGEAQQDKPRRTRKKRT